MDDLRRLIDRTDVIETVDRLFIATDRKDWDGLLELFSGGLIQFDMTSLAGGQAEYVAASAIAAAWRQGLDPIAAVHHHTGNHVVTLDGDRAKVFCYGTATHYRPEQEQRVTTFVGSYDFELRRDGDRWRVTSFTYVKKYVV